MYFPHSRLTFLILSNCDSKSFFESAYAQFQNGLRNAFPNLLSTLSAICWQQCDGAALGKTVLTALRRPFCRSVIHTDLSFRNNGIASASWSRNHSHQKSFSTGTSAHPRTTPRLFASIPIATSNIW